MNRNLSLVALPLLLIALAAASCASSKNPPQSTPTQSAAAATATEMTSEAAEAAATTFVEAWETFDYRDQKSRFNRVLPLLAADRRSQYTAFHENGYARMDELTGTTSVTASQVTDVSGDSVTVAVTTERFRHFIVPGSNSEPIEQSSVEQVECHLALEGGQWLVDKWQIESERLLPSEPTPTPSGTTPSPYASDPVISMVAKDFVESYSSSIVEDVWAGEDARYTDSSGTVWIRFGALSHWYSGDEFLTAPFTGIMKETSDGNWELVNIGTSGVECGVPADVQSALGFLVCPAGPDKTTWAKGDEEADKAIKEYVSSHSGFPDTRVDDKKYYTDSSGMLWLEFNVSPVPNGLTDPARGYMAEVLGSWVGVSGPGTALMECDLPTEVQMAFRHRTCLPDDERLDQAIKAFVTDSEPPGLDNIVVDSKISDNYFPNPQWIQCGALLVRAGRTEQVYFLMKKTPQGNWEGVAAPSTDITAWCNAPAEVLPHLDAAVKCPTALPP